MQMSAKRRRLDGRQNFACHPPLDSFDLATPRTRFTTANMSRVTTAIASDLAQSAKGGTTSTTIALAAAAIAVPRTTFIGHDLITTFDFEDEDRESRSSKGD